MDILIFFTVGIIIGWLIRKRSKWVNGASWGTYILLGLLIFIMGVSTGSRPDVLRNFSNLGFIAIILAFGGIAGSIIFILPASRKWHGQDQ